ncbi:hypothetical protein [Saccharothrix sp. HUAS TT1]
MAPHHDESTYLAALAAIGASLVGAGGERERADEAPDHDRQRTGSDDS